MPLPLALVGAGMWAYRGISAYRAYRAATLAARVGTAGVAAMAANEVLQDARENARTQEGVTTDYCASC